MGIFKKQTKIEDSAIVETKETETLPKEEWVWIEGYKATDKDMKCKGYQFELGKMFTHEGELIACKSGFHFCPELMDCFYYYEIGNGNRYFKVRALINIHQTIEKHSYPYPSIISHTFMRDTNKRVARQIEFLEEVSLDEIFETRFPVLCETMSEKRKMYIIQYGIEKAYKMQALDELKETNVYSQEIIDIIVSNDKIKLAYALTKENISQDTRLLILLK